MERTISIDEWATARHRFLTGPMRNHDDEVTGVLQLINAKNAERETISFTEADQHCQ